jgi:replicative DNA helicase
VGRAIAQLAELQWHVDDTGAITPLQMRSKLRRMKAQHGLGLVVVDYLQLMGVDTKGENRTQDVSALSRALKGLAKELDVPVVMLSQLSRRSEERAGGRPQLSDLRESGALEQDADVVGLVYRQPAPNGYKPVTELILAKQRNGPIGMIELHFTAEQMRFSEVAYAHD